VIVDTSAVVAILLVEADAEAFARTLAGAAHPRMSTATYVELICVCDRRVGADGVAKAERLIERAMIELVPLTAEQAKWARHARLTYGVGRHPACLNFGDCFAYALAKESGAPLLYKGSGFSQTDMRAAL
jgi:ribonuclease VapC